MWCRTPMTTSISGASLCLVRTSTSRKDKGLSFLSPANAPLLVLVVPIALVGTRWGLRWALAVTVIAVALVLAPIWARAHIDLVGYLSRTTTFVTVAILAGAIHQRSHQTGELAASLAAPDVAPSSPAEDVLSRREIEVLAMVAEGAQNSEIADRLTIAETTVQSHVQHILHKLGARNRTEAAARYLRRS
jgi:DNA-binding CsgD family transcriptional regulator